MKKLLLTALALVAAGAAMAGDGLNPQFLKWRKMKSAGMLPQQRQERQEREAAQMSSQREEAARRGLSVTAAKGARMVGAEGDDQGLVPDVNSLAYLADLVGDRRPWEPVSGYPRRFDLREKGCVTGVRDQGDFETCWAFAAYGSLESAVLVQKPEGYSYTADDIDFSERHLVDNHGFDLTAKQGGSLHMAMAYLLRWGGPASESDSPYPAAGETNWTVSAATAEPRLHVQQVRWIPGKTAYLDNDSIKDAVMNEGGVYVTFYVDKKRYFNAEKNFYYCPESRVVNHGVTIVGWDDDREGGAYLVKNSWGEDWGDDGYFWVSYYDANFGRSSMSVFSGNESKANYATIYQYDELGYTDSFKPGDSRANAGWMANVYEATNADTIAAVGFYALAPNVQYRIRVYTNVDGAPSTGKLAYDSGEEMTVRHAGYVTIPLTQPVAVAAGTKFAVCAHLSCPTYERIKPLACEGPIDSYSSRATASEGQSWYSSSAKGATWRDFTTLPRYRGCNFCLKAYGLGDADAGEHLLAAKPKSLDVTGPAVVAAGATGVFAVTTVFDDNSTYDLDVSAYEIVSGGEAVAASAMSSNVVTVAVRPDLAADTRVVVSFSTYSGDADMTTTREIAFTATQAAPSAPTGLIATEGTVDAGVRLAWDAVTNAASYSIYRSESGDARNATFLTSVVTEKYTDTSATPGLDYVYFVKAINASGASAFSAGAPGWRCLAAPEGLSATDGDYDYVQLEWSAAEGAGFYRVYRDEDMDANGEPTTNAVAVTDWIEGLSCRDTPPEKGRVYYYWVKAALSWTGHRASACSIFDAGSRLAPVTLSAVWIQGAATVSAGATTTFSLMAELSNGTRIEKVTNATWRCSGAVEAKALDNGDFELTAKVGDKLVASNTLVTVSASWTFANADGEGTKEDAKAVVITPVVPAKPNAVKLEKVTTDGVALAWEEVDGASLYRLYRGETAETAQLVVTTGDLGYLDKAVIPGAGTRYWLEALNAAGSSERSGASELAMRQLTAPAYVTASNGTSTEKVTVTWRGVTGAKFYRVSRADAADGERHDLSGWIAARVFEDATAVPGETYWYFVEAAANAEGLSGSACSAATIGQVSAAQTLAFVEIDGPSSIQYDAQGSFVCTATYANGVQKRVRPAWSFKASHALVAVDADGVVTAGHVTGDDLHLELQASYTDNGVTKTDSFAVTILAFREAEAVQAQVQASNVVVRARWPWNGKIDITYDLYSTPATTRAVVTVSGRDHDLGETLQAVTLEGDGVDRPAAGGAPHKDCRVTWDLGADYTNFHASAFSVSLDAAPFAVAAPANFRASDATSTNGVELAWEASFGAASYEIYRSLTNVRDDAERVASVTNETTFTDSTATAGETYYYWIRTVAGEFPEDLSDFEGPAKGVRKLPPYAAPSVDLQDGLVAYYPFDGSLDDASGNGHHLAFVTGESPASAAGAADEPDGAYAFAGATQLNATTNGAAALTGSFTFAAWVKTDFEQTLRAEQRAGFNTGCNFLVHPASTNDADVASYGISVAANGVNLFECAGAYLPAVLRHPAALGDGWHFVAFTVSEDGAPILYVDGAFAKAGISTGRAKRLLVGEFLAGGEFGKFTGAADDVCYYDRALTAEEISALFDAGSPLAEGKPVSATPAIDVAYADGVSTVTIACVEEGADADAQPTVYYTISRADGGATVESREYTVPFEVEGNATVVAWSVKDGYYNSPRAKAEIRSAWKKTAHDALADTDAKGEIEFETLGDGEWVFDPDESSDEANGSMRSGAIGADGVSTLVAKVKGAGSLAFDWKVSSESAFDFLAVTVDGEAAHKISGEVGWTQLVIDLTNDAPHVVRWTYSKDSGVDRGRDCGWVDFVTWAPEGTAVDSPLATVTPVDGGASNEVTLACTKVPGATIEYRLAIFGVTNDWQTYEGPFVVEGDGEIFMRAKKTGYFDSYVSRDVIRRPWGVRAAEALLMDDVTKEGVALSPDYFGYGTDEAWWFDQDRATVSDGTWASMKSPSLAHGETASFYAKVTGAGTLYFDRKVDSEAGWDVLTYYAGEESSFDYAYGDSISGDIDWERVKVVFHAKGDHVIEWNYDKDDTGSAGRDCGWIDYLKWVPARFAPEAPDARTGYVFGGYATNENGVAVYEAGAQLDAEDENETFLAVWTPITYTLRYGATSADGTTNAVALSYDQDYALLAATNFVFARGFAFRGWKAGEETFADQATVRNLASAQDAEVVLEPVLGAISYVVKFFDEESAAADDVAAAYGESFALPALADRADATFAGWALGNPSNEVVYAAGAEVGNLADVEGAVVSFYAQWTPVVGEETKGEAVEQPNWTMTTDGDAEWFVQTNVVKVGASALQSGAIAANQSSTLAVAVTSATRTRLSFWWKVSSEANWDFLKFMVNGVERDAISGTEGDWTQVTITLPAGTNRLAWAYSKDGSVNRGDDCGWIDGVTVEEIATVVADGDIHVATTGSDETGDGTAAKPFRTVQRGVDQAAAGQNVLVHPGRYEEHVVIDAAINLVALEGPVVTEIACGGCGEMKAMIRIRGGIDGEVRVWGFTLTGGRGQAHENNTNKYGGAIDIHSRAFVRDCVMRDNGCSSLTFAGAVHVCDGAFATLENCLMYGNYAWACGGATLVEGQGTLVASHCTAAGNDSDDFIGRQGGFSVANTGTHVVTNSIAYGNGGLQIAAYGSYYGRESILQVGSSCVGGGAAANGAGNFTDLGGNVTEDPGYFTLDVSSLANGYDTVFASNSVPYQSNLRATKDMGFSFDKIQRWQSSAVSTSSVFTVTQYCISKRPYTVDDALAALEKPSIWTSDPVTQAYSTINFVDNSEWTHNFKATGVKWPATIRDGAKAEYFVCTVTATLDIPEAGEWTFACGSDDGFRCVLTDEDGETYSFEYFRDRAYATSLETFNFAKAGTYTLDLVYFEYGDASGLDLSCAKGAFGSFSKSRFKLLGTPESGITLVGGENK